MHASARLPVAVSAALAMQLTAAAGALAGPWAVSAPGPASAAARAVAAEPAGALPNQSTAVALSAPGLWPGSVPLVGLGVDDKGALEVPRSAGQLGFWRAGPRPGQPGAAIVVGHVDLDGQPGIFARLAAAPLGAVIEAHAGGEAVRFRVTSVERYRKTRFPTDEVYRPTTSTELRLITCGGRFDRRTGHYDDNVVVRAVRV